MRAGKLEGRTSRRRGGQLGLPWRIDGHPHPQIWMREGPDGSQRAGGRHQAKAGGKERPEVLLVYSAVSCQGRRARGAMGFPEPRLTIMRLSMGMLPRVESPGFKPCLTNWLCNFGRISTSLSLHFHICKMWTVVSTAF